MNLSDMIRAAHARMADVPVDVGTTFGWVAIGDQDDESTSIFMQGDDADEFIESARALYDQCGDVTIDEVYSYLAEPYVENL